jgi:flagellar basal body-associated protein FliL
LYSKKCYESEVKFGGKNMKIALIIAVVVVLISIPTYSKWSYAAWSERCEENAKHPDWTPFCGKNFLDE